MLNSRQSHQLGALAGSSDLAESRGIRPDLKPRKDKGFSGTAPAVGQQMGSSLPRVGSVGSKQRPLELAPFVVAAKYARAAALHLAGGKPDDLCRHFDGKVSTMGAPRSKGVASPSTLHWPEPMGTYALLDSPRGRLGLRLLILGTRAGVRF